MFNVLKKAIFEQFKYLALRYKVLDIAQKHLYLPRVQYIQKNELFIIPHDI